MKVRQKLNFSVWKMTRKVSIMTQYFSKNTSRDHESAEQNQSANPCCIKSNFELLQNKNNLTSKIWLNLKEKILFDFTK